MSLYGVTVRISEGIVRNATALTYFAWELGQLRGTGNSDNRGRLPGSLTGYQ